LPEGAESAEIVIPSLAEQEDVNLMMGDADTRLLKQVVDRPTAGAIEGSQIVVPINCDREVDVSAFVENFNPVTPEGLEAGNLAHQRSGQRTEQRDRAYLFHLCQIGRYRIRCAAELRLPYAHQAILFRYLLARGFAGHCSAAASRR
jgi:hypothetical protein